MWGCADMAVFASRQIVMPVLPITVTITGSGSQNYCYAIINGTKRYSEGTHEVNAGDTITFGVYATTAKSPARNNRRNSSAGSDNQPNANLRLDDAKWHFNRRNCNGTFLQTDIWTDIWKNHRYQGLGGAA